MGGPKLNTITDPLGAQKTAAANLGLQNYQTALQSVPSLQNFYNSNFGQSPTTTLGNMDPLFQQTYGALEGDVSGQGGPFTSLQKNLLGAFDTQANQAQAAQNAQLQQEGIYSSGLGMGANNNLQAQLATNRGALSSEVGVDELNMAQQLSQSLMGQNQLMGFTDPMQALQQISSLSQPPQFQNIDNSFYTPQSKFQTTADIIGMVANGLGSSSSQQGSSSSQQGYYQQTLNGMPGLMASSM
jgi:hypothetical protein